MTGFEKILQRYGEMVTVFQEEGDGGTAAMALIQPIRDRERQAVALPLGWRDRERWLYLGEPNVSINVGEGGYLQAGDREFEVYSARRVDLGRRSCHWWGILVPREEQA